MCLATSPEGTSWYLHNSETYETKRLANPAGGAWDLEFSEDGYAYVDDGETSTWVTDILQASVWLNVLGEKFFCKGNTHMSRLHYFSGNRSLIVKLPFGSNEHLVDLNLWLFRKRAGCNLWWCTTSVYKAAGLCLSSGASKWLHRRVAVWCRWLEKLSLEGIHFRRSKAYGANQDLAANLDGDRVLEVPTMSSMALLAVTAKLCALAWRAGGMDQQNKAKLDALMRGLMSLMSFTGDLHFFMDLRVQIRAPASPMGQRHVVLKVCANRVNLDNLLEFLHSPANQDLPEVKVLLTLYLHCTMGDSIGLWDFLQLSLGCKGEATLHAHAMSCQ